MVRRAAIHDVIMSRKAPKPVGPYVHAVRVSQPGEMLFVSGQIPIEMPAGKVFTGDIKRQAEIAFAHLRNIVVDAHFAMDEVVRVTIFLTDLENFDAVNAVYQKLWVGQNLPARVVVGVAALPKGVGIEVACEAVKKGKSAEQILDTGDDD